MKSSTLFRFASAGAIAGVLALVGCKDQITGDNTAGPAAGVLSSSHDAHSHSMGKERFVSATQFNLVANNGSFTGARVDPNLMNGWGISVTPTGIFWLSSNGAGVSVVYNNDGSQRRAPVTIPAPGSASGGTPSGVLFNGTTTFLIKDSNAPARFIFSTEDGTIAAWNAGNSAVIVADRSGEHAIYKGIAMGGTGSRHFLCATDFYNGKVDVFDENFQFVTDRLFRDREIPEGYAPFGIRDFNGFIVVTYSKQKLPEKKDDEAGPGFGFVDVFNPAGHLVHRIGSHGTLNSPWGLELSRVGESGEDESHEGVLYVGNFGDGKVSLFTMNGKFLGLLKDAKGKPVVIDGLWGLSFDQLATDQNKLFFTAGPNDENDGLFGYLMLNPSDQD
jgi:uncharacterized protein (TIGR03118 family)